MNAPTCPVHSKVMKSRDGQYGQFWSCGTKNADGSWCNYKPPKAVEGRPGAEARFNNEMAVGDAIARQEKKDHSIVRTALIKSAFERGSFWSEDLKEELEEAEAWINK